jgi:hypothetical protein
MKLKPRQIVGIIAIVVFGGGMIWRLTQPSEREIMERRLASLPRISAPEPQYPALDLPDLTIPPMPAPPVVMTDVGAAATAPADAMAGSQEAKDDFYCWAVLGKEFEVAIKTDPTRAESISEAGDRLEAAGMAKLKAEGVLDSVPNWASLTVAYADAARADQRAGTLRIPVAACVERASRLLARP